MITHLGGGPIYIHSAGCPISRIATVRHTETIAGTNAVSQLKVSIKGQMVGAYLMHFSAAKDATLTVPITVTP